MDSIRRRSHFKLFFVVAALLLLFSVGFNIYLFAKLKGIHPGRVKSAFTYAEYEDVEEELDDIDALDETPEEAPPLTDETNRYTYEKEGIDFDYPNTWQLFTSFPPDEYKDTLFAKEKCNIYLQNSKEKSSVIMIEVHPDVTPCFGNGELFDPETREVDYADGTRSIEINKWRLDGEWDGLYLQYYFINDKVVALISKGTDRDAMELFDSIVASLSIL